MQWSTTISTSSMIWCPDRWPQTWFYHGSLRSAVVSFSNIKNIDPQASLVLTSLTCSRTDLTITDNLDSKWIAEWLNSKLIEHIWNFLRRAECQISCTIQLFHSASLPLLPKYLWKKVSINRAARSYVLPSPGLPRGCYIVEAEQSCKKVFMLSEIPTRATP